MGVHMHTLPDADRGIPEGGVAPVHGLKFQIGIAAPATVVQPQSGQRLANSSTRPSEGRFRVHPPPMSNGHPRIGMGPRDRRSESTSGKQARTSYCEAVDHAAVEPIGSLGFYRKPNG